VLSSTTPEISPWRGGILRGLWIVPSPRNASPLEVPIQSRPWESSRRQFTASLGKPSLTLYFRQPSLDNDLSPSGVANHIVPWERSEIDETVLEASPSAAEYVVNRPLWSLLTPRLRVPAHTAPSRLW